MRMVILGLRNLFRNKLRLAIVTVLIGVPFFLFLALQAINKAVQGQTEVLKGGVDVTLQVRARGSMGHVNMVGSDRLLPHDALEKIRAIEHVVKVEPYLLAMNPTEGHNFVMHVGLNLDDTKRLESHGEAGNPRIIAGRNFTLEDAEKPVALIGKVYAQWAGITSENLPAMLTVDPTRSNPVIYRLDRPKKELKIIGIYASGYVFGDQQLFMPMEALREIYGIERGFSWLFVTVDSVDHVAKVEQKIRERLGDVADIISPKSAAAFASVTTQAIQRIGGAMGLTAVALMAIVVFFIMLLVVRERAREIGTLKALGASNGSIAVQFLTEAFSLSLSGGLIGLALFQAAGSATVGRLFTIGLTPFLPAQYKETLFESLTVYYGASLPTISLAFVLCVVVTAAGSSYGIWQIVKLSPMEAMKDE
ncbi:MAG: ABC transporter permease [Candidatus Tectomicrobia bacterium]|nr:ABC transporter permease [Candidatus Tectomicrobia bacterium]